MRWNGLESHRSWKPEESKDRRRLKETDHLGNCQRLEARGTMTRNCMKLSRIVLGLLIILLFTLFAFSIFSFTCSALLVSLTGSAALIRLLAHSPTQSSWERGLCSPTECFDFIQFLPTVKAPPEFRGREQLLSEGKGQEGKMLKSWFRMGKHVKEL